MNEQVEVRDESLSDISIPSDIVVKSIGFRTLPIHGVPFDSKKNTIPHSFGCVVDPQKEDEQLQGLYVAGWAKRGPVGIIDATLRDSKETFGIIKHHLQTNQLEPKSTSIEQIEEMIPQSQRLVKYKSWLHVDTDEVSRGQEKNKVRDKILDREQMLSVALHSPSVDSSA
mmetsp:Transcript_7059/g.11887  ORF Transcript_7059/g.11887 Transcript_7059/m.11887 type:complete len:170 (+) Transcript_7059:1148-1657(+)